MTEAELRQAISASLDAYLYKLDVRYPSRDEFNELREETDKHDTAMEVLKVQFGGLRQEVARLGDTIRTASTWITLSLATAVLAALLNLVLK